MSPRPTDLGSKDDRKSKTDHGKTEATLKKFIDSRKKLLIGERNIESPLKPIISKTLENEEKVRS